MIRSGLFRSYCYLLAFGGGFSVMLLEMCAFRVLQTNFGSSIYVTGVLLALIMIALSAGYYLGGAISKRSSSLGVLFLQLVGAVLYAALVDGVLAEPVLDWSFGLRKAMPNLLAAQSIPPSVATFILYFVPMIILSQISPYLIKVMSVVAARDAKDASVTSEAAVGATSGNLMAISTIGSIVGTLLPSFVLIPHFGVGGTMRVFKLFIVLLLVLGWAVAASRQRALMAITAAVSIIALVIAPRPAMSSEPVQENQRTLVFESESHYGNVKVFRELDGDGDEELVLMPWRGYEHSQVHPKKPLKNQFTTAHINVGVVRGAKKYLLLGTALGGVASALMDLDPSVEVTAVEIDPLLVDLAKKYAPRLENPHVKFVVDDARVFLRETQETYDYIIADIFAGEQVPVHCISLEFWQLVKKRLAPHGVLHMNTNLMDNYVPDGLAEEEAFSASRHLQSSLLHAGFASLFQSEFFLHGHLYAFAEPTEPAALRAELADYARVENHSTDVRASAALAALTLVPVPDGRRAVRPFSDAWVPDHLLHLKQNFGGHLKSIVHAKDKPAWAEFEHRTDLHAIVARHYVEFASSDGPTVDALQRYMKGPGGTRYCEDVERWMNQSQESPYPDLAKYFHTLALEDCHAKIVEEKHATGPFARYLDAAWNISENRAAAALPSLLEMSNSLRRM
ncbi:fused MFS/spermidine synthase [Pendulispora brunnea]|uniref:Fused MFS/spermidine synthase n=1 Tax=Pendulispora brunnea TaxID=2905690 RepID=A0ABZ2KMS4_9BACT